MSQKHSPFTLYNAGNIKNTAIHANLGSGDIPSVIGPQVSWVDLAVFDLSQLGLVAGDALRVTISLELLKPTTDTLPLRMIDQNDNALIGIVDATIDNNFGVAPGVGNAFIQGHWFTRLHLGVTPEMYIRNVGWSGQHTGVGAAYEVDFTENSSTSGEPLPTELRLQVQPDTGNEVYLLGGYVEVIGRQE